MSLKRILVTGATGKQGGALISALLASTQSSFSILALTRDARSVSAQKLAARPNVTVLEGDLNDIPSIFGQIKGPLYGVFSVQGASKPAIEEKHGKSLIDAALAKNVEHFVYTSVDRGGPQLSDVDPTPVPHLPSKFNIEQHLKNVVKKSGLPMKYSIIRPVAFMDNSGIDYFGRMHHTLWTMCGSNVKLQLVSTKSIGILAAEMFQKPAEYDQKAVSLATDELTPTEANAIFLRVTGKPMPTTFTFVGRLFKWLFQSELGIMYDWFNEKGYGADTKEYVDKLAGMQSFEEWLIEYNQYSKRK